MKKKIIPAAIAVFACGVVAAVLVYNQQDESEPITQEPQIVSQETVRPEEAYTPSFGAVSVPENMKQHYTINPRTTQLITGTSGIILLIPDNAFTDKNGNAVSGKVKLELVEGLTHEDIINMNLGTMSDNGILETGGMIYVDAKSESGEELVLTAGKTIEAEIPTLQVKPGMQLWQGEENADGSITWVNPEPINSGLHQIPVDELDTSIAFIRLVETAPVVVKGRRRIGYSELWLRLSGGWTRDTIWAETIDTVRHTYETVRLNDERFRNTNIATAEFRSRLPYIRQACDSRVMSCYTDNPNRELWKSDQAAADTLEKSKCELADLFRQFAKTKQGKVDPKDPHTVAVLDAARDKAIQNYSKRVKEQQSAYASYSVGMKKLGWANVDRLCGSGTPMVFNAHVDGIRADESPVVSLLIPGRGIFLPGYRRPNGDYSFTHGEYEQTAAYPKGEVAFILARSGSGDQLHYGLKQVILGTNKIESLEMKDGTEAQLAAALGSLPPEKKEESNVIIDDWNTKAMKSGSGCLCGAIGENGIGWIAK